MKQILSDVINVITSINNIDLLLYISILVLIILVVSLIYIIKNESYEDINDNASINTPKNDEDLKTIVNNIENSSLVVSEFTDYEKEQEERAIISYEELLAKSKMGKINYEEENVITDDITIKKINLNNLMEEPTLKERKNMVFGNYKREEEFLNTLKTLNELLG